MSIEPSEMTEYGIGVEFYDHWDIQIYHRLIGQNRNRAKNCHRSSALDNPSPKTMWNPNPSSLLTLLVPEHGPGEWRQHSAGLR